MWKFILYFLIVRWILKPSNGSQDSPCSVLIGDYRNSSGRIYHGFDPESLHDANQCTWNIRPNVGDAVYLTFEHFQLDKNYLNCHYGNLTIIDRSHWTASYFCADKHQVTIGQPIYIPSTMVDLVVKSSELSGHYSFIAHYQAVTCPALKIPRGIQFEVTGNVVSVSCSHDMKKVFICNEFEWHPVPSDDICPDHSRISPILPLIAIGLSGLIIISILIIIAICMAKRWRSSSNVVIRQDSAKKYLQRADSINMVANNDEKHRKEVQKLLSIIGVHQDLNKGLKPVSMPNITGTPFLSRKENDYTNVSSYYAQLLCNEDLQDNSTIKRNRKIIMPRGEFRVEENPMYERSDKHVHNPSCNCYSFMEPACSVMSNRHHLRQNSENLHKKNHLSFPHCQYDSGSCLRHSSRPGDWNINPPYQCNDLDALKRSIDLLKDLRYKGEIPLGSSIPQKELPIISCLKNSSTQLIEDNSGKSQVNNVYGNEKICPIIPNDKKHRSSSFKTPKSVGFSLPHNVFEEPNMMSQSAYEYTDNEKSNSLLYEPDLLKRLPYGSYDKTPINLSDNNSKGSYELLDEKHEALPEEMRDILKNREFLIDKETANYLGLDSTSLLRTKSCPDMSDTKIYL